MYIFFEIELFTDELLQPEAVALLKKSIYHTAPKTHMTVPRLKTSDAVAAAFDPNDDPIHPPPQSASEQQVKAQLVSLHGLRMWDQLLRQVFSNYRRGISTDVHTLQIFWKEECFKGRRRYKCNC